MWVISQEGFFSAVRSDRDGSIMVRARVREDLENLKEAFERYFKNCDFEIVESTDTDYRYRIIMPSKEWIGCLVALGAEIDYPNFKSHMSKLPDQKNKVPILHKIWSLFLDLQPIGKRLRSPEHTHWDPYDGV